LVGGFQIFGWRGLLVMYGENVYRPAADSANDFHHGCATAQMTMVRRLMYDRLTGVLLLLRGINLIA